MNKKAKWLLIGLGALVVIALVVALILGANGNEPAPTEAPVQTTEAPTEEPGLKVTEGTGTVVGW